MKISTFLGWFERPKCPGECIFKAFKEPNIYNFGHYGTTFEMYWVYYKPLVLSYSEIVIWYIVQTTVPSCLLFFFFIFKLIPLTFSLHSFCYICFSFVLSFDLAIFLYISAIFSLLCNFYSFFCSVAFWII